MNPPKKIKVGPSVYPISLVDEYPTEHLDIAPEFGLTDTISEQIYLKMGRQSEGQLKDSTLHEALHAVYGTAGFALPDAEEERIISRLVPWLLMLIQDNPKLVAYLQEKVK